MNFAVHAPEAEAVVLELYGADEEVPVSVIEMPHRTAGVHHCLVRGAGPGQRYAFRARGPYAPDRGRFFNPTKLLLDPYAKAIDGTHHNRDGLLYGYTAGESSDLARMDSRDSSPIVPKCVVIDDAFDWQGVVKPRYRMEDLVIYETHVKGFTAHPSSGSPYPGTYLGFLHRIDHLVEIGVNAVELLPVHQFYSRDYLEEHGLHEYWGYNTVGFFAPEWSYGSRRFPGCQVNEFKTLVRELHRRGIEVILDVVYNHTGEGGELGPTLSFRGLDNRGYYLNGTDNGGYPFSYRDLSGTGNTIDIQSPVALAMIIDSLKYWAGAMGIDGFRFDLASILARTGDRFTHESEFFQAIETEPLLDGVKLIAEPWDLSTYQVGNFPHGWSEWNGKFRDTVRRFLIGEPGQIHDLGNRLTGSADLYQDDGRSPWNSVNFVTCHDGFTLNDLYSYSEKHNEENLEGNRDGMDSLGCMNFGVEGPSSDPVIASVRERMAKNALCVLLFSLGTPMLLGGDEFGRTQKGNNNAYCQDNGTSWYDWDLADRNAHLVRFVRKGLAFRAAHPILREKHFFSGIDGDGDSVADITWYSSSGTAPSWEEHVPGFLAYQLDGSEVPGKGGHYHLFFILNSRAHSERVVLPLHDGMPWRRVVDTNLRPGEDFLNVGEEILMEPGDVYWAAARSVVVLKGEETARPT